MKRRAGDPDSNLGYVDIDVNMVDQCPFVDLLILA